MLLAFDTAGVNRTTVALVLDDGQIHGATEFESPAECLVPLTQQVLAVVSASLADIHSIAVGVGPGPYTGLRIGLAHAHALAHALHVPIVGVSSLAAVAATVINPPREFLVATDARRKEVFSVVVIDTVVQLETVRACSADEVSAEHPGLPVIGDGGSKYREVFEAAGCAQLDMTRDFAHALGVAATAALVEGTLSAHPVYLREPDAVPSVPLKAQSL
jgi:tRNA threonylcarbamoyl adenosine modification protein YeaZ